MLKSFIFNSLLVFFAIFIFSSCVNEKKLLYFQKSKISDLDTLSLTEAYVPKVHSGDILSIYVNSLNAEASSFFNPYVSSGLANSSSSPITGQASSAGYLVDPAGIIQFPLLGNIKVGGYTTSQVRDTIKSRLKVYLKEPTILVRFLNFKISILGEVNKPEVYTIPNEMITLPEALSMAGDMTIFARRDSIQIIRDMNGKKEIGYVNLNNREIFKSPYYYLHANDLIYIKPSKVKAQQTDRTLAYSSLAVSILSLLFIILRK